MFDINEVIQSQPSGSIESHNRFDLEHYYIKFSNGRVLSILRGESPISGEFLGDRSGNVETAVLIEDNGNLSFDLNETSNAQYSLDAKGLLAEIDRVAAL